LHWTWSSFRLGGLNGIDFAYKCEKPHITRGFSKKTLMNGDSELQVLDQVRENVADGRAEQCQNDDNDDCDQNQNQSVFYEALAFFAGHIQHVVISPCS